MVDDEDAGAYGIRDRDLHIYHQNEEPSPIGLQGSQDLQNQQILQAALEAYRLPVLVSTYVKERDNNKKGGKTGVLFWFKVYCLFIKDIGEAYIFYINGR